ncbi:MAG TPA: DUF3014 domain-containing protein [Burkholderiales bacterium]|nr:DUF3014 domain-containing protein [Burkholderiales bacterium]
MEGEPGSELEKVVPRNEGAPYWLEKSSGRGKLVGWLLAAILIAVGGAYWFWQEIQQKPPGMPVTTPQSTPVPAPAPQVQSPPAIQHPIEQAAPTEEAPAKAAEPLPTLEGSDQQMLEAIAGLIGPDAVAKYVYADRVITRIVATVDNLPRHNAPEKVMPVKPVAGAFVVDKSNGTTTIGAANAARYDAYVTLFEALPAKKMVRVYVYFYPLFQKAYQGLGYPNRYFNDRLFEAIDDLLAAPEPQNPIVLDQPKVLYTFADPALEERSAGQKIMMRLGLANEQKVKAKLRVIRRALVNR